MKAVALEMKQMLSEVMKIGFSILLSTLGFLAFLVACKLMNPDMQALSAMPMALMVGGVMLIFFGGVVAESIEGKR